MSFENPLAYLYVKILVSFIQEVSCTANIVLEECGPNYELPTNKNGQPGWPFYFHNNLLHDRERRNCLAQSPTSGQFVQTYWPAEFSVAAPAGATALSNVSMTARSN
jgi:hypothetical protein